MQPEKRRPQTSAVGRVKKMIHDELGWLRGFPLSDGNWKTVPLDAKTSNNKPNHERIRAGRETVSRLRNRFPRALPKLVGDVHNWAHHIHARLECVNQVCNGTDDILQSSLQLFESQKHLCAREKNLIARAESARELITALIWTNWDPLPDAELSLHARLDWLHLEIDQLLFIDQNLASSTPVLAIHCADLVATHGPEAIAPVLAFLARDDVCSRPMELLSFDDGNAANAISNPQGPAFDAAIRRWIEAVVLQPRVDQKKSLQAFRELLPPGVWSDWKEWWAEAESTLAGSRSRARRSGHFPRDLMDWPGDWQVLRGLAPLALPASILQETLDIWIDPECRGLRDALAATIPTLPRDPDLGRLRLVLASRWRRSWTAEEETDQARLCKWIRGLAPAFERWLDLGVDFGAWGRVNLSPRTPGAWVDYTPNDDEVTWAETHAWVDPVLETFHRMDVAPSASANEALICACETIDPKRVIPLWLHLGEQRHILQHLEATRLALQLGENDTAVAADICLRLDKVSEESTLVSSLRTCSELLGPKLVRSMFVPALREIGSRRLETLAGRLVYLKDTFSPAAPDPGGRPTPHPPSFHRYPPELKKTLDALLLWDKQAERTADRVLGSDFPDPERIRRELVGLETFPQLTSAQQQRMKKLQRTLSNPPKISPQRVRNLKDRLEAAVGRAYFEQLEARTIEAWQAAFQTAPDLDNSWSLDEDLTHAVIHIADLPERSKQLAAEILKRRGEPGPWDFRESPANQLFLERLQGFGIDVRPWIDAGPTITDELGKLGVVQLGFERDPLMLFHMGRWFGTCLSPGHENYFSVFTIIADINKQVVYARDRTGRVVGRTLLGLTNSGSIVPFHNYCDSESELFSRMMTRFVIELATQMSVTVVGKGAIATLVGPKWYDDGPEDLAIELPDLEKGSEFRVQLQTISPDRLLSAIESILPSYAPRAALLPKVLYLEEFDSRPELATGLDALSDNADIAAAVAERVSNLLLAANSTSKFHRWARVLERKIRKQASYEFYNDLTPLQTLVRLDPARGLRALRGKERMRDWCPDHFAIATRAYLRLGRTRRAYELLDQISKQFGKHSATEKQIRGIFGTFGIGEQ